MTVGESFCFTPKLPKLQANTSPKGGINNSVIVLTKTQRKAIVKTRQNKNTEGAQSGNMRTYMRH